MRIGETEIAVSVGARTYSLRPTLRCAYRLERRYKGFEPLARAIMDGTVYVIADLLLEAAPGTSGSRADVEEHVASNLANLDSLTAQLLPFIFALCGVNEDSPTKNTDNDTATGKPEPLTDFYLRLFSIATGWLGWTPEAAWNATPAEIMAAYKGRTELLNAVFGVATDTATDSITSNAELDREGLEALRSLGSL